MTIENDTSRMQWSPTFSQCSAAETSRWWWEGGQIAEFGRRYPSRPDQIYLSLGRIRFTSGRMFLVRSTREVIDDRPSRSLRPAPV